MTPDELDRLAEQWERKRFEALHTAAAIVRDHAALLRWADQARGLLGGMGPHHPTCDVHWNRPCNCGEEIARLLAALDAVKGGHQ